MGAVKDELLVHEKPSKDFVEAFTGGELCGDLPGLVIFCGIVESDE